jgi:hypothetical protein
MRTSMEPTLEALEEALAKILPPDFEIGLDKNGQIIIFTGLIESEDGELIPLDDETAPDLDPDFETHEEEDDEED